MPVPRNQVRFRQSEAARLLRASKAAGVPVKLIVTRDGDLIATPIDAAPAKLPTLSNWDDLLDQPKTKVRAPVQGSARKDAALLPGKR
jgi:hypothetical protein